MKWKNEIGYRAGRIARKIKDSKIPKNGVKLLLLTLDYKKAKERKQWVKSSLLPYVLELSDIKLIIIEDTIYLNEQRGFYVMLKCTYAMLKCS